MKVEYPVSWWRDLVLPFIVGGLLGVFFAMSVAHAHSKEITGCANNKKYSKASEIGERTVLPNGMLVEHYDTNGDGKPDVDVLSSIDSTVLDRTKEELKVIHNEHPVFWIVDSDFDGQWDVAYIDRVGAGKCEDIVMYEDLRAPKDPKSQS